MRDTQRGLATVEFSLIGLLMIIVFIAVVEFGRMAGCSDFCSPSGSRGIGRVDHRAQERPFGFFLSFGISRIFAFCISQERIRG